MTAKMTFIPVTELTPGRDIAGAHVAAVRTSKSGLTVYITARRPDGSEYEFSQSASTRIAVWDVPAVDTRKRAC